MKKIILGILAAALMLAMPAFAQDASKELVSKQLADAISSGKFYMKIGGDFSAEGMRVKFVTEMAMKGDVIMNRMEMTGMNNVVLCANGYNYMLDEAKKTYTIQPTPPGESDASNFGKLTFMRQGTCQLNGSEYYYDEYRTQNGQKFVFYYNSAKVAAVEMDLGEGMEEMAGPMSLLSFNPSIPKSMYFCLGKEWKKGAENSQMGGMMGGQMPQMSAAEMEQVKSQLKSYAAQGLIDEAQIEKMLKQMGGSGGGGGQAPEPPRCNTPWTDNTQGVELAAGTNLGAITLNGKRPTPRDNYVYASNFRDKPAVTGPRMDLNVTDEGVWLAFEQLSKAVEGMTVEQAVDYVNGVSSAALTCAEMNAATGQIIEQAVAACMVNPSSLTYNNAGMLFVHIADDKHALDYFKQAEKIDPENPSVLTNIADCYLAAENTAEAERYVAKALMFTPDFGPALQMRTTLLLKKGKYEEAAEALLRCAAHHFSDITAAQFNSFITYLSSEAVKADGQSVRFEEVMNRLMPQKNIDLLKEAMKAGFKGTVQAGQPERRTFEWPYEIPSVMLQRKSLKEMADANDEAIRKNRERAKELNDEKWKIYFMAGAGYDEPDAYAMLCSMHGYEGKTLLDLRQFWCLQLWQTYYQLRLNWAKGLYADSGSSDGVKGDCPESFRVLHQRNKAIFEKSVQDSKELDKCMESNEGNLAALVECQRAYYDDERNNELDKLVEQKKHYEASVQPVLEEYWATMTEMLGYCNDTRLQEWFVNEMLYDVNSSWLGNISGGAATGESIYASYEGFVVHPESLLGIVRQQLAEEEAKRREALKSKDVHLKNYGEKEMPDFGGGIPTPIGTIGFMYSDGEMSVSFHNELTGNTTIKNLNSGNTTTLTTYITLADEMRGKDKDKNFFVDPLGWTIDKVKKGLIDKVGNETLKATGLDKFNITSKSDVTRQHARTRDRMGNQVDTGDVTTYSQSVSGAGLTITSSKSRHRSGNSYRTKHHLNVGFGKGYFIIGK